MAAPKEKSSGEPSSRVTPPGTPPTPAPRRNALRTLAVLGTIAYAGALAIPAALFVAPKEGDAGRQRWVRVARLADLPEAQPHRANVIGDERDAFTLTRGEALGSVWLIKRAARVHALSATCPHLGCAIDIASNASGFACPCHASRFALDGEPESGPSPRAMDSLETRIVDGWVEVDYRRFREGVSAREEVSA